MNNTQILWHIVIVAVALILSIGFCIRLCKKSDFTTSVLHVVLVLFLLGMFTLCLSGETIINHSNLSPGENISWHFKGTENASSFNGLVSQNTAWYWAVAAIVSVVGALSPDYLSSMKFSVLGWGGRICVVAVLAICLAGIGLVLLDILSWIAKPAQFFFDDREKSDLRNVVRLILCLVFVAILFGGYHLYSEHAAKELLQELIRSGDVEIYKYGRY